MSKVDTYAVLRMREDKTLVVEKTGYADARSVKAAVTKMAKENPDVAFFPVRMWSPVAYQEIKKYEAVKVDFDFPEVDEEGGDDDGAGVDATIKTETKVEPETKVESETKTEESETKTVETSEPEPKEEEKDDGSDSSNFEDLFGGEEATTTADAESGELF